MRSHEEKIEADNERARRKREIKSTKQKETMRERSTRSQQTNAGGKRASKRINSMSYGQLRIEWLLEMHCMPRLKRAHPL